MPEQPSWTYYIKRWGLIFFGGCLFGAALFSLPGVLTLFGIGSSAAANVAAACSALHLNILISKFGVLATLSAASLAAPFIILITGIVQGFMGIIHGIGSWWRGDKQQIDPYQQTHEQSNLQHQVPHRGLDEEALLDKGLDNKSDNKATVQTENSIPYVSPSQAIT